MDLNGFEQAEALIREVISYQNKPTRVLPDAAALSSASEKILQHLPEQGIGLVDIAQHLTRDIVPSLNASSRSPNYYGFVTGGVTPAARLADNIVTVFDQNLSVHLPNDGSATIVEDRALSMLCELLHMNPTDWPHRIFTTGATASNILGLACGRDFIIAKAAIAKGAPPKTTVAELGISDALRAVGLDRVQILATVPHSSLVKAASVVGLGRSSVKIVATEKEAHKFDFAKLEGELQDSQAASIVSVSCGEINTGFYATSGLEEMQKLRGLCNKYGAWLHVDGAFGLMARIFMNPNSASELQYESIVRGCEGMELADSITGDCHKLLNVPYDCGFFISKHRDVAEDVFLNANAAYLKTDASTSIAPPMNIGLENSRRFRALPAYASLVAYGRKGHRDMLARQVSLARKIAELIMNHSDYILIPETTASKDEILQNIFMIVIFKAKDDQLNKEFVKRINGTNNVYVTGTAWEGKPAARFAVSNWQVDVDRDLAIIEGVLNEVVRAWKA